MTALENTQLGHPKRPIKSTHFKLLHAYTSKLKPIIEINKFFLHLKRNYSQKDKKGSCLLRKFKKINF